MSVQSIVNKVGGSLQSGVNKVSETIGRVVNPVVNKVSEKTGLSTSPSPSYRPPSAIQQAVSGGKSPSPSSSNTSSGGRTSGSSGRGGGGGSSPVYSSSTPSSLVFSPQGQSQQAQDKARTLASQNVNTQRDALQRDQNYIIEKPSEKGFTGTVKEYYNDVYEGVGSYVGGVKQGFLGADILQTSKGFTGTVNESMNGVFQGTNVLLGGVSLGFLSPEQFPQSKGNKNLSFGFTPSGEFTSIFLNPVSEKKNQSVDNSLGVSSGEDIYKPKGLFQTVKDIRGRQEETISSMKTTSLNPLVVIPGAFKLAYEEGKMAYANIGTTLGGLTGLGATSTPTFESQSQVEQSKGITRIGGFDVGIPILAIGQTLRNRDITEQATKINLEFSKQENLTEDVFTQKTTKLQTMGLGSTNSSGDFNFNMPTTLQAKVWANPQSTKLEKYGITGGIIAGTLAETFVGGYAFKSIGAVGAIERGSEFLINTGKAGKIGVYTFGTALTIAPPVLSSISSAKEFSSAGASPITGAVVGGLTGVAEVSGFVTGASGGEFLFTPGLKYRSVGISNELGQTPTKVLSLENPFGKGSYPLVTKSPEGFSIGYPSKMTGETFGLKSDLPISEYAYQASSKTEVGFVQKAISQGEGRLATEQIIFEQGLGITEGLSGVKIKEVSQIPFEKSGVFENLGTNVKAKEVIKSTFTEYGMEQKGFKGFINTIYERTGSLERIYGSSTISTEGGFNTNFERIGGKFGDFDLNFRGLATPKAEALFGKLKATGADVKLTGSLIELKNPKTGSYEHAFDFHGADTPDLQMASLKLGIKSVGTKAFGLDTGTIKGQQLRQSLVDKGSATLQLRTNKANQFYFSPPDYRLKDITDFVSIAERLNTVKGGNVFGEKIESFKNVLKVAYPEVKFGGEADSKLLFGSLGKTKTSTFSISSQSGFGSLGKELSSFGSLSISPKGYSPSSFSPSSKSLSPSKSPFPSMSPYPYSPSSPSPSTYFSPSPYPSQSSSPSPSPSSFSSFSPSPVSGWDLPSLGGFALGFPKSRGRKSGQWNIAPSFTGIVQNIKMKSPLKVSATFGVTPFQTRGLLVGKKSKGDYFQLTDL